MRTLGVIVLGLFSGLLLGFAVTEIVARISVGSDGQLPDSMALKLLLGFAPPVLAVLGAGIAVAIDNRLRRDDDTA